MKILSISVTEEGRALAERLPWEHQHGQAADTIRARWPEVDGLVLFLATGAAVRIIGPLLEDKHRDPAVVCVDEAGRFAVALCGGHRAGPTTWPVRWRPSGGGGGDHHRHRRRRAGRAWTNCGGSCQAATSRR